MPLPWLQAHRPASDLCAPPSHQHPGPQAERPRGRHHRHGGADSRASTLPCRYRWRERSGRPERIPASFRAPISSWRRMPSMRCRKAAYRSVAVVGRQRQAHPNARARECILVVEDDARVRKLIITRLKLIGYRVLEASDDSQRQRCVVGRVARLACYNPLHFLSRSMNAGERNMIS
jgi:hypothetical protein